MAVILLVRYSVRSRVAPPLHITRLEGVPGAFVRARTKRVEPVTQQALALFEVPEAGDVTVVLRAAGADAGLKWWWKRPRCTRRPYTYVARVRLYGLTPTAFVERPSKLRW